MTAKPDLAAWNRQSVVLSQVLLGVISPNFRMIILDYSDAKWTVVFILERDDAEDREEIEDLLEEWDALSDEPCRVRTCVNVDHLHLPQAPARVVYKRREVVASNLG